MSESSAPTIKRLSYTHDAMIDVMVAQPQVSQRELAATFGYSESWVSIIMSSDAFRARLAQRRGELVDTAIAATIEEKFHNLANKSLNVLLAKMDAPASMISDALALKAAELGAKALNVGGLGNNSTPMTVPQGDRLERLADRLTAFLGPRAPSPDTLQVIDVSAVPAASQS